MAVHVERMKELLVEERRRALGVIECLHNEKRLAAIPWATYCIDCKRLRERL